jgi:hypothetical protein
MENRHLPGQEIPKLLILLPGTIPIILTGIVIPVLRATVTHDSSVFHGDLNEMWVASSGNGFGYDSWKQSSDNPRGGYIIRKFMPENRAH